MQLKVFLKDSTINMSEIGTGSIDLVITSPPYWDIVDYGFGQQLGRGLTYKHFLVNLKKTIIECMRVIKDDCFIIFVVGDIRRQCGYRNREDRPRIYPLHSDIISYFMEMDFDFFQHYFWKKCGINKPKGKIVYGTVGKGEYRGLASPPFLYSDLLVEHVLVFRKPGVRRILPDSELRFKDEFNKIFINDLREWVDPVWNIDSPHHKAHPATFPKELIHRLIKMFSFRNDVVLDPFSGTGTTLSVAFSLQRNSVGYELKKEYIDILAERYPNLTRVGNCWTAWQDE